MAQPARCDFDKSDAGATLIEAIAAFAIAAGAVLAVAEGLRAAIDVGTRAQRLTIALNAAQSAIERIGRDIEPATGRYRYTDGAAAVSIALSPSAAGRLDASPPGRGRLLDVVVEARHLDGGRAVTLRSLVVADGH